MITPRQNFVRLDIGKNSVGKTPTQIYDVIAYQKSFPRKKIIVFEGQDKFYEAHKRRQLRIDLLIPKNNKTWAKDLMEFKEPTPGNKIYKWANSLLIIDDFKLLLSGSHTPEDFLGLFALRPSPKFNMDMMFSCHEARNILPGIAGYIDTYHIYANESSATQFEDRISCYLQCQRASLVIQKYERLYPGRYDVNTHTPYFPHIRVEKDNPEPLHCINMDYSKAKPILEEFTNKALAA